MTELTTPRDSGHGSRPGSALEVSVAFLKLGLMSFGGPIAHLGYFHREFVERRRWIDGARYAQLVALCQFLPGPASSQVGFSLGLLRAGWSGALAACIAFTLPSALLMLIFARLLPDLDHPIGQAGLHGLKLVAVVIVATGVWGMVRTLTPDLARRVIAALAAAVVVLTGTAAIQMLVVVAGALLGLVYCRDVVLSPSPIGETPHTRRTGAVLLAVFAVLLVAALVGASSSSSVIAAAATLYRVGALVFGGGHVVLPLLQEAVVATGRLDGDEFLAGYGAAQAIPGPMFSLGAFVGARVDGGQGGLIGAIVSLVAIFLPGFLLVAGTLPFWQTLAGHARAASALAGVNAAVVGVLAAALYDPVWTSAVLAPADFAIVAIGITALAAVRTPILVVIAWCVSAAILQRGT